MRDEEGQVVAAAHAAIRHGSLSFALAARLLGRDLRDAIAMLYMWCRHCDDVIDGQVAGHKGLDGEHIIEGAGDLPELRRMTAAALAGESKARSLPMRALAEVAARHRFPAFYAEELLAGMAMDVDGLRYETLGDLQVYCYRVAGTVGLLFSHIAGVSAADARRHAAELGMAMQLTNIARDVADDYSAGRVYLPHRWLTEAGLTPDTMMMATNRVRLHDVVVRLLAVADDFYRSGDLGLAYLPWRSALAVATARHVYGEIGAKILAKGPDRAGRRVTVSTPRKFQLVGRALWQVARTIPRRILNPWRPAPLDGIWRLT